MMFHVLDYDNFLRCLADNTLEYMDLNAPHCEVAITRLVRLDCLDYEPDLGASAIFRDTVLKQAEQLSDVCL